MAENPKKSDLPQVEVQKMLRFSDLSELNLERIIFKGELEHRYAIVNDPIFSSLLEPTSDQTGSAHLDGKLAKNALKLDLRFSPVLQETVARCQNILKLKRRLDVYVVADPNCNAFSLPNTGDTFKIVMTSALLEKFEARELAFVMGHEIGHALFGHANFLNFSSANQNEISPLHMMTVFAWKRAAEVSADRVGLLCCEGFDQAARTLFKSSYGFDVGDENAIRHYVNEFHSSENSMAQSISPEDYFSTHPFGPPRVLALEAFSRGQIYSECMGKPGEALSREETEKQIKEIISIFDSSYLKDPSSMNQDVRDFLVLGSVAIAACDGEVNPSEIQALNGVLSKVVESDEISKVLEDGPQITWKRIDELAQKLCPALSPVERCQIIRDFAMIVLADGQIKEQEVQTILTLAARMQLGPEVVSKFLAEAAKQAGQAPTQPGSEKTQTASLSRINALDAR